MHNKPIVSSFAVSFKKATAITEDAKEAKKEHRKSLKTLVDKYFEDIVAGKAEGIRTAKEFVEVIKADLLLMGEATERKEDLTPIEAARITKITQALDISDPNVQSLIEKLMMDFNDINDETDASDDHIQEILETEELIEQIEETEEVEEVEEND